MISPETRVDPGKLYFWQTYEMLVLMISEQNHRKIDRNISLPAIFSSLAILLVEFHVESIKITLSYGNIPLFSALTRSMKEAASSASAEGKTKIL